jgi:hypothetical protein
VCVRDSGAHPPAAAGGTTSGRLHDAVATQPLLYWPGRYYNWYIVYACPLVIDLRTYYSYMNAPRPRALRF